MEMYVMYGDIYRQDIFEIQQGYNSEANDDSYRSSWVLSIIISRSRGSLASLVNGFNSE